MLKRPRATFALILAAGFAATPAFAEPPWKRGGDHRDTRNDVSVPATKPVADAPSGQP
jgi:hypothetical protein